MGRHRRSGPDAAPVIVSSDPGRSGRHRGSHRRAASHGRTGMLGASAALTVGAVAVGAGLLPGLADRLGQDDTADVRAQDRDPSTWPLDGSSPSATLETDGGAGERAEETAGEEEREPAAETSSRAPATEEERDAASDDASAVEDRATGEASEEPTGEPSASPSDSPSPEPTAESPEPTPDPEPTTPTPQEPDPSDDPETVAADQVLALVNEERARAGCQPLVRDAAIAELAADHSRDMAERGYFDHTDPDGRTPWDRAEAAGVDNLGGENIAWGQQDAQAVMDSWMNSEGHRANILNCDFRTMGVGVHMAEGGPWWTQGFGF